MALISVNLRDGAMLQEQLPRRNSVGQAVVDRLSGDLVGRVDG